MHKEDVPSMNRKKALIGVWAAVVVESLQLMKVAQRPHSPSEFALLTVLIFATISLGGVTVFSLPEDKG